MIYTIEFQKRGLPHAHILIFLAEKDKNPGPDGIDNIISAEIPDEKLEPHYYSAVKDFMLHGPCGVANPSSLCTKDYVCKKHFPKRYVDETSKDKDGYPVYRRRDNGRVVLKSGVPLDNRYAVLHNRYLLMKYGAHINVEWCNQSRSIKYLFKYINKGHDRVTAAFYKTAEDEERGENIDEVDMYYDCRYISSCEAAWRLFGFEMQYRDPPVERLSFHLPGEQNILFNGSQPVNEVVDRATAKDTMFLAWFEANKKYEEARELTYAEFPTKFVWKADTKEWVKRKQRYKIGRIFYVPPGSGEKYHLRCLLNIHRGPFSYEDIRTVRDVTYDTYRDACFALGMLDDDKEYIHGIIEASS